MRNTALTVMIAAASFALTFAFAPAIVHAESSEAKPAHVAPAPVTQIRVHPDPDCRTVLSVINAGLRGKVCR